MIVPWRSNQIGEGRREYGRMVERMTRGHIWRDLVSNGEGETSWPSNVCV